MIRKDQKNNNKPSNAHMRRENCKACLFKVIIVFEIFIRTTAQTRYAVAALSFQ